MNGVVQKSGCFSAKVGDGPCFPGREHHNSRKSFDFQFRPGGLGWGMRFVFALHTVGAEKAVRLKVSAAPLCA
jgi:hypothetical protein